MRGYIVVKTIRGVRKVYLGEIHYLLRRGRKIFLYGDEGELSFNGGIKEVAEGLDGRFFKVIESCYINLDRVKMAEDGRIIFDDESSLLLSREAYVKTKQRLFGYLRERNNRP